MQTQPTWKLSYSYDEAVLATGISRSALERAVRNNVLFPSYVGSKPIFLVAELQRYLDSLPTDR